MADLRPDLHYAQIKWLAQTIGLMGVHRGHARRMEQRLEAQQWLFPAPHWADEPTPTLRGLSDRDEALLRFEALRICVDHHPILFVERPTAMLVKDISHVDHGGFVVVAGMMVTSRRVAAVSAKGERRPMAFATIEDETGVIETVWFPEAYRRCVSLMEEGGVMLLRGIVQIEFGVRTVSVDVAENISDT